MCLLSRWFQPEERVLFTACDTKKKRKLVNNSSVIFFLIHCSHSEGGSATRTTRSAAPRRARKGEGSVPAGPEKKRGKGWAYGLGAALGLRLHQRALEKSSAEEGGRSTGCGNTSKIICVHRPSGGPRAASCSFVLLPEFYASHL